MKPGSYRVEVTYPVRGNPKYFLVKDIKVGYRKRKVKKYLGVGEPGPDQLARFRELYANELETRAARKKAEKLMKKLVRDYDSWVDPERLPYHVLPAFDEMVKGQ